MGVSRNKWMRRAVAAVAAGVLPVALALPVGAATFTVTNTAASGPGSLNQAIADADTAPGPDTIAFAVSTNGATIPPPSSIGADTTLQGNGAGVTIISGLVNVNNASNINVRDVSVGSINVNSGFGASANATFENVVVTDGGVNINSGFDGSSTTATLSNVTVQDNGVNINSGFEASSTTVTMSKVTVTGSDGINANSSESTTTVTMTDVGVSAASGTALNANGSGTSVTVARGAFTGGSDGIDVSSASVALTNSTVSGLPGTGLDVSGGTANLQNVNVTDNGAGIDGGEGVTLRNSIVAGNATDDEEEDGGQCDGAVTSLGGNIATDDSCGLTGPGDQPGTDPLLGALGANGGSTATQLPLVGSPAIDAGVATGCPGTDQRGVARPQDGNGDGTAACDSGAVEVTGEAPAPTTAGTTAPPTAATTAPAPTVAAQAELPATGAQRFFLAVIVAAGLLTVGAALLGSGSRRRTRVTR